MKMKTQELITQLSRDASPKRGLLPPAYLGILLMIVLAVYGSGVQLFLGIRSDIGVQFGRPMFAIEIALLIVLTLVSALASMFAMYPDTRQKQWILKLPYGAFVLFLVFIFAQLPMAQDVRMVIPSLEEAHGMECTACITFTALIPAALIFGLMRKGASVHPRQAGSFAVLTAAGLGCLTLRLAEADDSIMHLAVWHYLPTLFFAVLGASIGRWVLKW